MKPTSFTGRLCPSGAEFFPERKLKIKEVERNGHMRMIGGNTFRMGNLFSPEWRDCHA